MVETWAYDMQLSTTANPQHRLANSYSEGRLPLWMGHLTSTTFIQLGHGLYCAISKYTSSTSKLLVGKVPIGYPY